LNFFDKLVGLHTVYWQKRNKPGAFASDFSQAFHRQLISSQNGPASVELLELAAGPEILDISTISNMAAGFIATKVDFPIARTTGIGPV